MKRALNLLFLTGALVLFPAIALANQSNTEQAKPQAKVSDQAAARNGHHHRRNNTARRHHHRKTSSKH